MTFLNSLSHLNKVYEPRHKKVRKHLTKSKNIVPRPKLPQGFISSGESIIHRYHGKDFPHFGIFSGDVLTIRKETSFLSVQADSLYAVQLPDGQTRICAISYRGLTSVLHDGRGNDFKEHRTALLTLIGEVLRGEKCL